MILVPQKKKSLHTFTEGENNKEKMLTDNESAQLGQPVAVVDEEPFNETKRFRAWRKHVRAMYQTLFLNAMHNPCPTVQMMPYVRRGLKENLVEHFIVAASNAAKDQQSYLMILKATTPPSTLPNALPFDNDEGEYGGYGHAPNSCRMIVDVRMYHEGGVCRARLVPQNPNLIVTASTNGNVYVFDKTEIARSKRPNNPQRPQMPVPPCDDADVSSMTEASQVAHTTKRIRYDKAVDEQQRFDSEVGKGQHKLTLRTSSECVEGTFALDVNIQERGVVCAGHGKKIRLWSVVDHEAAAGNELDPFAVYDAPGDVIDVRFDKTHPNIFYAVTEKEDTICVFDIRSDSGSGSSSVGKLPTYGVSIDSNPIKGHTVAIGLGNGCVEIRDARVNISVPVVSWQAHAEGSEVTVISWCPHSESLLCTAGEDGDVKIWDFTSGSSPPLLRFSHCGHTATVNDVSWSWSEHHKGMITTCSGEDQLIMMWRPRNYVWTMELAGDNASSHNDTEEKEEEKEGRMD